MINLTSVVNFNFPRIREITEAQIRALEQTGEALHTEVVQAEVMPRDTGALQNEYTFLDTTESSRGIVSLVSTAPYARRLYFHPEYNFQTYENAFAQGKWYEPWISGIDSDFCKKMYQTFLRREANL